MPYTIARLKVEDYDKFKQMLLTEDSLTLRQAYGFRGGRLFRSTSDPQEIISLSEWNDLEMARQFYQSSGLRERQQSGGVISPIELYGEADSF